MMNDLFDVSTSQKSARSIRPRSNEEPSQRQFDSVVDDLTSNMPDPSPNETPESPTAVHSQSEPLITTTSPPAPETSAHAAANDAAGPAHSGDLLAAQRTAMGLSTHHIADRMKLSHQQIEAIEFGQWNVFPSTVMLKSFLRAYAKILQLDPEPVLAALPANNVRQSDLSLMPTLASPLKTAPLLQWLSRFGWQAVAVIVGLAIVAGVWWQASSRDGSAKWTLFGGLRQSAQDLNAMQSKDVKTSTSVAADAAQSSSASRSSKDDKQASQVVSPKSTAAVGGAAPMTAFPIELPHATAAKANGVHLVFSRDAWVEVSDAAGPVFNGKQLANSDRTFSGQPPFNVVVGNAASVQLFYQGKPIDLRPFIRGDVARVTLE